MTPQEKILDLEIENASLKRALKDIESHRDFTRLADCCVEKSCHINLESGLCSFQTGVHYGNADRAATATEALTATAPSDVIRKLKQVVAIIKDAPSFACCGCENKDLNDECARALTILKELGVE